MNRIDEFRLVCKAKWGALYEWDAMARRLGISRRQLIGYAKGENEPPVTVALAIADDLGVTVAQLDFRRLSAEPSPSGPSPVENGKS